MLRIKSMVLILWLLLSAIISFPQNTETELVQKIDTDRASENWVEAASGYNKLAMYYWEHEQLEKALQSFDQSVSLNKEIGNNNAMKVIYNHMATIYSDMGEYETSLVFYRKSLLICHDQNNKRDILAQLLNIGSTLMLLSRNTEALENLIDALPLLQEVQDKKLLRTGYRLLSEAFQKTGNAEKSMEYMNLYSTFNNQIQMEALEAAKNESKKAVEQAEKETKKVIEEKKQTEQKLSITQDSLKLAEEKNRLKELEIQKKQAELKSQQLLTLIFIIGMGFIAVVALLVLRSNQQKKRHNKILEHRNEEIRKQNEEIKSQNLKISQSINYASNIQGALLPDIHDFKNIFPESFIYFSPRDIVSGDFYWFHEIPWNNDLVLVAAIDCTGHGVPGAFMSMLGMSFLEEIVLDRKIIEPSEILENLHKLVKTSLKQDTTGNSDGMDASICLLNKQTNQLKFAGAVNSILMIKNNQPELIKGDFFGVGGTMKGVTPNERWFTQQQIEVEKSTCCYIFTDGFIDQFGGSSGKKFLMKNFKQLLTDIHQLPFNEQKEIVEKALFDWHGQNFPRLDDVLIMGFKF